MGLRVPWMIFGGHRKWDVREGHDTLDQMGKGQQGTCPGKNRGMCS